MVTNIKKKQTKRDLASAEKRKTIYVAAIELFKEYGYENTTLDDISKASGMSRGSIYHFFTKKIDMLYYFFSKMSEDAMNSLEINDDNLDHPAESMLRYVTSVAASYEELGYELSCQIQNVYLDIPGEEQFSQTFIKDMKAFIEAAQKRGTCNVDVDSAEATHSIHIATAGVFRKWIVDLGRFSLAEATEWYCPYIINLFVPEQYKIKRKIACPQRFSQI